jgi:SAM-dependent methyltransferase
LPDTKQIYQNEALRYQALVAREDYEHNLLPAILSIDPLVEKDIVELGAGTGRVSRLIAPLVRRLVVSDVSLHMLALGKSRLSELDLDNWYVSLESHRSLPFTADSADVIIAGWSFCYAALDAGEGWRNALDEALAEAERVLRPGGKLILIESLGTGYEAPNAPPILKDYLAYLNAHNFVSNWIRTDYCFRDKAEAVELTGFFFGDDPMPMWESDAGVIVPECTGLWWKAFP